MTCFRVLSLVFGLLLVLSDGNELRAAALSYFSTTVGGPTWNRPLSGFPPTPPTSTVSTAVPYHVQPFYVTGSGLYNFLSLGTNPSGWDNYTFLYRNSFNPLSQFTNVIIGNDDFPSVGRSGFNNVPLVADVQYFLITTGFLNSDAGAFTNTITGEGANTAVVGVVPEPSTMVVFAVGIVSYVGYGLRRRKPRQLNGPAGS